METFSKQAIFGYLVQSILYLQQIPALPELIQLDLVCKGTLLKISQPFSHLVLEVSLLLSHTVHYFCEKQIST